MVHSAFETASHPLDVEISVVLDQDDPKRQEYLWRFGDVLYTIVDPKRQRLHSDLWNVAWENASGDIAMLCADDLIFETPGWDLRVLEEFENVPDGILNLWCNDGTRDTEVATHPFIHRNWIDTVGFFTPPYFRTWYADTWLLMLGIMAGRTRYLNDVTIKHLHHVYYGNVHYDDTYARRLAEVDPALHLEWKSREDERTEQARRLLSVMDPNLRVRAGFTKTWSSWGHPVDEL